MYPQKATSPPNANSCVCVFFQMRVPGAVFTKTSLVYFLILLNCFVVTFTDRMVYSGMQFNFYSAYGFEENL